MTPHCGCVPWSAAFPGPVRPPFTRAVVEGGALCNEDTGVLACPGPARTPGSHDGGGVADPPHTGERTVISELTGLGAGTSAGFALPGAVCLGRWTWADTYFVPGPEWCWGSDRWSPRC